MKIVIINSKTDQLERQGYLSRLQQFLHDLSCNYPYFEEWLERVFSLIQSGERTIILCEYDDEIVGASILKDTQHEKKICTVRVATQFHRQGIGTMLLIKSREILKDDFPLITVSDEHIDSFRNFLLRFRFKERSKIKSVYRYGHDEYYFNKPYHHQCVLMSIKPDYAHKILSGEKTAEFRKVCFGPNINKVYIYSSSPEKKIIGYFEIEKIERNSPTSLWQKYGDKGCIDSSLFYEYYKSVQKGTAICIKYAKRLRQEVRIDDVFDVKLRVPQNYIYIDNVVTLRRLRLLE